MNKIKITLHARYTNSTSEIHVFAIGTAAVLDRTQNRKLAEKAGLPEGDYWHYATDPEGNRYDVFVLP
jgi:hypothetical protein